jgi:hypothetical protein
MSGFVRECYTKFAALGLRSRAAGNTDGHRLLGRHRGHGEGLRLRQRNSAPASLGAVVGIPFAVIELSRRHEGAIKDGQTSIPCVLDFEQP